jgi:hypothetical protein
VACSWSRRNAVLKSWWFLAFIGLALFLKLARSVSADEPKAIRDFSKGLITQNASVNIPDGASPSLLNVDVQTGSLQKRAGSIVLSSSSLGGFAAPVRFIWEFNSSTGTQFIVSASSTSLFKSVDGGVTNTVLDSTHGFTTFSQYCAVNAYNTMRLTDGTTNWVTFDGTNLVTDTATPHGLTCAFFGQRVWTSTGTTLRGSDASNPGLWVAPSTTPLGTDTIFQPDRPNTGRSITCLRPFQDRLMIFTQNSLDVYVLNTDGLTYTLSQVSNTVGTTQCNSVVERERDVTFLAADGIYSYITGSEGGANYKGYGGNIKRISDAIIPTINSIKQINTNVYTHTENTTSNFNTGTLTNVNTTANVNAVTLSTQAGTEDFGFELPSIPFQNSSHNAAWVGQAGDFVGSPSVFAHDGNGSMVFVGASAPTSLDFTIVNSTGGLINDFGNDVAVATTTAWTQVSHDWSAFKGQSMKIVIQSTFTGPVFHSVSQISTFTFTGAIVTYWVKLFSPHSLGIDTIEGIPAIGLYRGAAFSNNNAGTYGTFTAATTPGGGTVGPFTLYTDTDTTADITNPATFVSSQVIVNNQVSTMTPSNFSFFVSSFSINNSFGLAQPQLNSLSIRLNGGTKIPTWGVYTNNNYLLSVSTNNNARNDTQIILDRNEAWTLYNYPAYCLTRLSDNSLLMGSAADGNIWQINNPQYTNDNGVAISASWRSKDFDFEAPLTQKTMQRYYLTADYLTGSTLTFSYGVNQGATTSQSWDLGATPGIAQLVVKPSSLTFQRGIQHNFTISNAGVSQTFNVRSVTMDARKETPP